VKSFKLFVVSAKCYYGDEMKGGIGSASNTHLIYENYGIILVGRSSRDQLQDLSVRESVVLRAGVRNGRSHRTKSIIMLLVRCGIGGLWRR